MTARPVETRYYADVRRFGNVSDIRMMVYEWYGKEEQKHKFVVLNGLETRVHQRLWDGLATTAAGAMDKLNERVGGKALTEEFA